MYTLKYEIFFLSVNIFSADLMQGSNGPSGVKPVVKEALGGTEDNNCGKQFTQGIDIVDSNVRSDFKHANFHNPLHF